MRTNIPPALPLPNKVLLDPTTMPEVAALFQVAVVYGQLVSANGPLVFAPQRTY